MTLFFRCVLCISVLILGPIFALGQNLVPNGSFEEYIDCPSLLSEIEMNCVEWFTSRITCDYYHSCSPLNWVNVPDNVLGWQEALSGNAYAGFIAHTTATLETREHLSVKLIEPLEIGQEYFFSYYVSSAFDDTWRLIASNGLGVYLTKTKHSSIWDNDPIDNPSPVTESVQYINYEIINDTTNWVQVKGSFSADSAYTYLVIGCFLTDDLISYESIVDSPFGEAYYYIDEVRLSSNSDYAWEELTVGWKEYELQDIIVYPNPIQSIIYIESPTEYNWHLYSVTGRLIKTGQILRGKNEVDIADLASGIYLFQYQSEKYSGVQKIMKE